MSITPATALSVTFNVASTVSTERADLEAAKAAYVGLLAVSDEALASPKRDWSSKVREFAINPAANAVLADVALAASSNVHMVGHTIALATITSAEPQVVHIHACLDTSGQDILDSDGNSLAVGGETHHPQDATVVASAGRWFVKKITSHPHTTC
jgi:hypothetical protein